MTYSVGNNMIFWTAGPNIWNMTWTETGNRAEIYGEFGYPVVSMAYDWIAGNLYLVRKYSRVVVCASRGGAVRMLCSELKIEDRGGIMKIAWLSLDPSAG